jgi:predicted O-methyltransferase YrrM
MKITEESLKITENISNVIDNKTFHHQYHILYDIAKTYNDNEIINYVEIGCYGGGSACLLLQRPNTNVISIDLGSPISPMIVLENVDKLNPHNNFYKYIIGNSQLPQTKYELLDTVKDIDILFIDGDHSYYGLKNDFELYNDMVKQGGYIIFDDYNDHKFSPEVKLFVDDLIPDIIEKYEIIGVLPNIFNARPSDLKEGNCFIIKKKIKKKPLTNIEGEKIGIIIPTYYRKDNLTNEYLTRALTSVKNQTYQNYKLFLIGDRYENIDEFNHISNSIIDKEKIYSENLKFAEERDVYKDNKWALWSYGGVYANNYGINLALNDNINYICHLDHDDYWSPTHLENIVEVINNTSSPFICAISKYMVNFFLPKINSNDPIVKFIPECTKLIHSSTCINFNEIPLRYVDFFKETGNIGQPSDCILWTEIAKWLNINNKTGYLINKITCFHEEEGYVRK